MNPSAPQPRVGELTVLGCGQRGVTLHLGPDSKPLLRPCLKSAECSRALLATSPPRAAPAPALFAAFGFLPKSRPVDGLSSSCPQPMHPARIAAGSPGPVRIVNGKLKWK